jgi:uncharacterized protein
MPPTNQSTISYIGAGFSFPINVNVQGSVQLSNNTPNLEESIIIILATKLGERLYRPNFGSRLSELVFEPMNTKTLLTIRLYVEEALLTWEPRITINNILTIPDPSTGRVEIEIIYTPNDSYEMRSLVYPFYLQMPET